MKNDNTTIAELLNNDSLVTHLIDGEIVIWHNDKEWTGIYVNAEGPRLIAENGTELKVLKSTRVKIKDVT